MARAGRGDGAAGGAWLVVAVAGLLLGGCYYNPEARLDTISPIAGNSIAHNKAVQTIDPWPDDAFRRHQVTDGERVRQAYERYRGEGGGDAAGNGAGEDNGAAAPAGERSPGT